MSAKPQLAGQTVLVIGGSSGIGLETARRDRAEGADVTVTARNPDRLTPVGRELGARTSAFDATAFEQLGRFFQTRDVEMYLARLLGKLPDR
jgi:NAD(P)-dependent dehydrogenase (short-subunit alcohol dehydrogenase family)